MNTHIRNKRADEVWMSAYIASLSSNQKYSVEDCLWIADTIMGDWAERFGTEDDLADIEANKARREMGNEP